MITAILLLVLFLGELFFVIWNCKEKSIHRGKGKNAFRLMCSSLAEYAKEENVTYATQAYYNEHFCLILKDNALTKLADI